MWRLVALFLVLAILVNVSHQTPKNQDRSTRSTGLKEKCVKVTSDEGDDLMKTFPYDSIKVDLEKKFNGRCNKGIDYKIIGNNILRVEEECVARFVVCYDVEQKQTTEAAAKPTTDPHEIGNERLNGNYFMITNKKYPYANIRMNIHNGKNLAKNLLLVDVSTYEKELRFGREFFWRFVEDKKHKGWFRLSNFQHGDCLLAPGWVPGLTLNIWSYKQRTHLLAHCRMIFRETFNLWRLIHVKDGYYFIENFEKRGSRIQKKGKADSDLQITYGRNGYLDHELWKLTPKFKAEVSRKEVIDIRNIGVSHKSQLTKTTTYGITTTQSEQYMATVGITTSIEFALFDGGSASLSTEFSHMWSSSTEKSISHKVEETFTAPAGKHYRVSQLMTNVRDVTTDANVLTIYGTNLLIEESDNWLPQLNDVYVDQPDQNGNRTCRHKSV